MAKSDLTPERLRELLRYDPETGIFTWRIQSSIRVNAGDVAGCKTDRKTIIGIDGGQWRAHRLAWLYMTGEWPKDVIDHIDGNPHNNAFSNIRAVTIATNTQNIREARSNNKSGVLGVEFRGKSWRASVKLGKIRWHSKPFPTKEQAHDAYLIAKRAMHEGCTI